MQEKYFMEKIIKALEELKEINNVYELPTEEIVSLEKDIENAKVCTPIIGKFSSGKSALVNTLLGYNKQKILKEDITPETTVPAEIMYSDIEDTITIIKKNGEEEEISFDEYKIFEADAETVINTRIQLRNTFLKEIPDVMLVDMPGFESGFEVHNKAIDNYLPQSLAYIITFPADDMIVRSSVGNILKELCLHDMPLCITITKWDKRNEDEFDKTLENLKENLKKYVGNRDLKYCSTTSARGDASELKELLKDIQEKSQIILSNKYKKLVIPLVENTENYLVTTLNGGDLSESELDEKEEKLEKQLSALETKFKEEKQNFDTEITECVGEIKADVQRALEAEESTLVAMALNGQEINGHLNSIIRNTVTVSVKRNFITKLEKYFKRVAKTINSESIGDVAVSFSFNAKEIDSGITGSIVAAVAGVVIGLPIIGIALGAIMTFIGSRRQEEERNRQRQEARQKIRGEVFPQVMREVGTAIETTIAKQILLVNFAIDKEITNQKETLEKAMCDLREQINNEKEKKENLIADIKADLERIEEIKEKLR